MNNTPEGITQMSAFCNIPTGKQNAQQKWKHKQANISVESWRLGVIMTQFSRQTE